MEANRMLSRFRRTKLADRAFDTFNIPFMLMLIDRHAVSVFNTFAVSLNDAEDSIRGGIYLKPREFTLDNYEYVFRKPHIADAMISILRTVIGTVAYRVLFGDGRLYDQPAGVCTAQICLDCFHF